MPKLVSYACMSTTNNSIGGTLVKAMCEFCGKKFGSVKEAKKCESNHINDYLMENIRRNIKRDD